MMRSLFSCFFAFLLALLPAASRADDAAQKAKDATIVRALLRLPGLDLSTRPEAKAALLRHLETLRGGEQYLEIVEKFKLRECAGELVKLAADEAGGSNAVKAAALLLKLDERERLAKAIAGADPETAARLLTALGLSADARSNDIVAPLITQIDAPLAVRPLPPDDAAPSAMPAGFRSAAGSAANPRSTRCPTK